MTMSSRVPATRPGRPMRGARSTRVRLAGCLRRCGARRPGCAHPGTIGSRSGPRPPPRSSGPSPWRPLFLRAAPALEPLIDELVIDQASLIGFAHALVDRRDLPLLQLQVRTDGFLREIRFAPRRRLRELLEPPAHRRIEPDGHRARLCHVVYN